MKTEQRKEKVAILKEWIRDNDPSNQSIAGWIWDEIVSDSLSEVHGCNIPKIFCEDITESDCQSMGIKWHDVQVCQSGPDHDWYWEAWNMIEMNYEYNGTRLYQNGHLWTYDCLLLDEMMTMLSSIDADNDAIMDLIFS